MNAVFLGAIEPERVCINSLTTPRPLSYKKVMRILLILILIPGMMLARERFVPGNVTALEESEQPWFTGPLIASGATVIPSGHVKRTALFFCDQNSCTL